jgi:hypothetical protein
MDAEQQHDAPRPAGERIPHGQLRLLNTADHPEWQLDESTRALGRRGVEQARAALRAARGEHATRPEDATRTRPGARRSDAA